jgi:hypothetical protein
MKLLNLVLVPLFRATTNWTPEADIPAAIHDRFVDVDVREFTDGTLFVASGRRADAAVS